MLLLPGFVISSLLLCGCASVHTTSQADPGRARRAYGRLMVLVVTTDLALQLKAESSFVRAAETVGVKLVPSHTLFLPGKHYSDAEFAASVKTNVIEAILVLADATTDAPTVTRSATAVPLCTQTVGGQCVKGMTVVTGSERSRQDKFTVNSRLVDASALSPVWVGSTKLERNGVSDNALFTALARDVIGALVKAEIVATQARATPR